jgi:7-cyano-7-deazaguanine tRNA-ribosyltransferase
MSFEIRQRDMLARIGKIRTKSGTIETPVLLPVINQAVQPVSPRSLHEEYDCQALITNAYIIRKQKGEEATKKGVHALLDFDGAVMTDSGAYQILVYGKVEVNPEEIIDYQERISTDIATILDIPTAWKTTRDHAKHTVEETIKRAKQLEKSKTREDILWVAPVQGGQYLDLVAHSARQMGRLPFQIHALGSPTTVMEQYLFDTLVEMILTAKMNLPPERPFHLFGAGHPFMFALAVALGCDMFDSAAYAIYARQNRYMSEYGTSRISELEYFPCSCPICSKITPKDMMHMSVQERQETLAKHNLYSSFAEVRRVKQAIIEGRLWEHLESRTRSHPALLQAAKRLKKYEHYVEQHSPVTKASGLFFFDSLGLSRPEIVHYRRNLSERFIPSKKSEILVLLPQPSERPFHKAEEIKHLNRKIRQDFPSKQELFHVCVYAAPFGVVPLELDEVYPLSQHEIATPVDLETVGYVAERVREYLAGSSYKKIVLVEDAAWKGRVSSVCNPLKRKGLSITVLSVREKLKDKVLNDFMNTLKELVT